MKVSKELFTKDNHPLAKLFGDMAIKDLSPKDANSSGRIVKNLRICGSGLYEYHVSEAPLMGLSIPEDYHGDTFKIFRSPEVLEQNKELYARVPIITGHHVRVNASNAKQLAVGMIGDTITTEVGDDGELYLYTTGTIITEDGIEAYENLGELSVGYDPIVEWSEGEYKGQKYQAVLKGFHEINHVLICKTARGGHQCMIMDSLEVFEKAKQAEKPKDNGGKAMGIFKKIFGAPSKKMTGDSAVVSALLQSIKVGADAKTQVSHVKELIGDSADETLKGYFEDLCGDDVAQADKETLCKAIDVVDGYCKRLLGDEVAHPAKDDAKKAEPAGDESNCNTAELPAADEASKKDEKQKKAEDSRASAGDSIDYDRIINGVVEKLSAKKAEEPSKLAGDEMEVSRLQTLLAGDEKKEVTSDEVVKEIWG